MKHINSFENHKITLDVPDDFLDYIKEFVEMTYNIELETEPLLDIASHLVNTMIGGDVMSGEDSIFDHIKDYTNYDMKVYVDEVLKQDKYKHILDSSELGLL